ncbi:MAG: endolytic transglycosylase MltG [Firmicutes bacterium]|nr:endolytic transglycosylase MltG [[Eubacterium] siraeum]MCM1487582.1 endolytic transglycosylase MltG [Bacillota bacterium]
MDNNHEKKEYDSLSEMLKNNKERKKNNEESYQNSSEDYHDIDDFEDGDVKRYDLGDDTAYAQEDMHDIDFDRGTERSEEAEKKYTSSKSNAKSKSAEAEKQLKKGRQRLKTIAGIFLGIILSAGVLFVGVNLGSRIYNAVMDYAGMDDSEFQVQVEIPDNPTVDQVIDVLEINGIIKDKDFFKEYIERKSEKEEIDFVGGEFTLSSAMNYSRILSTLTATTVQKTTIDVTIIEGMTAAQIGELLEKNCVCKASDFLKFYREKMDVYDFERRVLPNKLKFNQLEGYLFPDKYEFYVCNALKEDPKTDIDTTKEAEAAASKIYSNFNSKISKQMYKQMNEMGLTLDELISLASMVQSEVGNEDDMRKVASVFLNRLHNSEEFPQLQSDVTVFYVQQNIEPYYKNSGLKTSLADISNAYDTYVCDGIPAGPICNPGMDAINAVLNPETTDYYYFCANEQTGETYYARTQEEFDECLVLAGLA